MSIKLTAFQGPPSRRLCKRQKIAITVKYEHILKYLGVTLVPFLVSLTSNLVTLTGGITLAAFLVTLTSFLVTLTSF